MATFTDDDRIELELLRDQEIDALVEEALIPEEERWNVEMRNGFILHHPEVIIEITTGHPYPAGPLECQVKNLTMPRIIVDQLRVALRHSTQIDNGANSIEKWTDRGMLRNCEPFECEMAALHIAPKTQEFLTQYRRDPEELDDTETKQSTADLTTSDHENTGIDLSTLRGHHSVNFLLGRTPEQICAGIPECFRILHIESVVRGDLHNSFLREQCKIRKQLLNAPLPIIRRSAPTEVRDQLRDRAGEKESLVDHLVNPHLTFHGTRRDLVPSIVRHGFLLPGDPIPFTNQKTVVRCGSTYGRGIYSSPSSEFSLAYSGQGVFATKPNEYNGLKLMVCATVMGISATVGRNDNWRGENTPFPGANSHVSSDQNQYVVFNRAQILPCYVIHLGWGQDNARFFEDIPTNPNAWVNRLQAPTPKKLNPQRLAPGDRQRAQEALKSKAAKWFPYGYGPATGTSFVIQEVGDVDEDDEDFGDYQKERISKVDDDPQGGDVAWIWDSVPKNGDKRRDEYYDSRRANNKHYCMP
ncbi:hypothetical protein MMC22_010241 [Lobaria immixta]|nr:hypothetical protein [Lobaria immixta]